MLLMIKHQTKVLAIAHNNNMNMKMVSSVVIVLAVIVIGFFAVKEYNQLQTEKAVEAVQTQDNYVKSQTSVSESTDIKSIETDLDSTDIDNLGEGL